MNAVWHRVGELLAYALVAVVVMLVYGALGLALAAAGLAGWPLYVAALLLESVLGVVLVRHLRRSR